MTKNDVVLVLKLMKTGIRYKVQDIKTHKCTPKALANSEIPIYSRTPIYTRYTQHCRIPAPTVNATVTLLLVLYWSLLIKIIRNTDIVSNSICKK